MEIQQVYEIQSLFRNDSLKDTKQFINSVTNKISNLFAAAAKVTCTNFSFRKNNKSKCPWFGPYCRWASNLYYRARKNMS